MSDAGQSHDGFTQALIDDLDRLIRSMIGSIRKQVKEDARIGDLIRMIELRYKLLPDHSSQKEFWKMMEKIRKEKLPSGKTAKSVRTEGPRSKRADS